MVNPFKCIICISQTHFSHSGISCNFYCLSYVSKTILKERSIKLRVHTYKNKQTKKKKKTGYPHFTLKTFFEIYYKL